MRAIAALALASFASQALVRAADTLLPQIAADFSVNCTSELTARFLLERGASRITPSYDLNREQLLDLVQGMAKGGLDLSCLEVVVHQHMAVRVTVSVCRDSLAGASG